MIARAAVPTVEARVWTHLHHPERHGCARVRVSVASSANKWIHVRY